MQVQSLLAIKIERLNYADINKDDRCDDVSKVDQLLQDAYLVHINGANSMS